MSRRIALTCMARAQVLASVIILVMLQQQAPWFSAAACAQDGLPKSIYLEETFFEHQFKEGAVKKLEAYRRTFSKNESDYYFKVSYEKSGFIDHNVISHKNATDLASLMNTLAKEGKAPAKEITSAWLKVQYPDTLRPDKDKIVFFYDLANKKWFIRNKENAISPEFPQVFMKCVEEVQKLKAVPPSFQF